MMIKRTAVVAGSFDPITIGHEELIKRTSSLFEKVIVAICVNSEKKYMFNESQRFEMISDAFSGDSKIVPVIHEGLVADLALKNNAVIFKGLRFYSDFDYEHIQSESNYMINGVETIFLPSRSNEMFITSSLIRELIKADKEFDSFVSEKVSEKIKKIISEKKDNE